ncbi:citrate synthase family protein [Phototrophicus methaneseepsis]|uniref:citrate synthase (unknown stereospecificity) n=1 Tax=Phototrophicus methaneseepsis TaxID=2710758 RepID=A0A7S8IFG7_9CHLR|nr:citrate synthase family protein [Phototrophicus methaneseepsis]QPC83474.1 citrate synthase family protein [Phototrophicus methaneseepsis]
MTAQEAAEALKVSRTTLYAYVSRGLIRSEAVGEGSRQRRYHAEDVQKLIERKQGRRNPEKLAQDALHWGTPVLDSELTLIANGRVFYRGYDVAELAQTETVERVASLLWTGHFNNAEALFQTNYELLNHYETMLLHIEMDGAHPSPLQSMQLILPIAAADDLAAYDLRPEAAAHTGARILRLLVSVIAGDVPNDVALAQTLQQGLCPTHTGSHTLLSAAMILCADHELNASSFTARVVAAAGASPYAAVIAGLSALQGVKHGGHTQRVEAFLREMDTPQMAAQVIAARLQRGEHIPGFGHRLYPEGDPRAIALLSMMTAYAPNHEALALANAVTTAAADLMQAYPTIDFALAILGRLLGLNAGTALALFGLGRTIGWVAHTLEQYQTDRLIRPRARYTGPNPNGAEGNHLTS